MNIYAVLDESDDESPPVKAPQPKKKEEKATGAKPAAAKPAAAAPAPAQAPSSAPKAKAEGAKKGGDAGDRRAPAPRKENTSSAPIAASDPTDTDGRVDDKGSRKRREEMRGGRGGKPQTNTRKYADEHAGQMPRQREQDRRSGTGRSGGQKKGGRGAHSFGNVEDEAHQAEKDPSSFLPDVEGETAAEAVEETPAVEAEPEPQAPPTRSLDEYFATRNEARANPELFGVPKTIRTVEVDPTLRVKTDPVASVFAAANKAQEVVRKEQRSTSKTTLVDLGFTSAQRVSGDDDRDRGDRAGGRGGRGGRGDREGRGRGRGDRDGGRGGGRGSGRGGGGRGGDRPRSSGDSGARIDVNDTELFPAL